MTIVGDGEQRLMKEDLLALPRGDRMARHNLEGIALVPLEARALGKAVADIDGHGECIYRIYTSGKGLEAVGLTTSGSGAKTRIFLPRRRTPGGAVRRLGRITKQGNTYLRMLLVPGARSAPRAGTVARQLDDLRVWARGIADRRTHNVAAVALANKLARVAWRVWCDQRPFERRDAR